MGLEEVELDIRRRIELKVLAIRSAAEKEASQILENEKTKIKEMKRQRDSEIEKLAAELTNREVAAANLSARKLKMGAKKELIERVYTRVREKILGLEQAKKDEILGTLIQKAVSELQNAKYVLCNSSDSNLVEKLAKKNGLKLGENINCIGGVIVENSDRTIRVDYTYETFLELFRKDSLKEVSDQLFAK